MHFLIIINITFVHLFMHTSYTYKNELTKDVRYDILIVDHFYIVKSIQESMSITMQKRL